MSASDKQPRPEWWSLAFEDVLSAELDRIEERQQFETATGAAGRNQEEASPPPPLDGSGGNCDDAPDAIARAHSIRLVGLAFSGGGIRSATFNLGVLQALAQTRILPIVDYLSTVSGGGYIGSWLLAWMRRTSPREVQEGLCPDWVKQPGQSEPTQIHFLRQFSNYLTPKLGWLGADMWTVITVYVRNLLLNLLLLGCALGLVLLAPRWIVFGTGHLWHLGSSVLSGLAIFALVIGVLQIVSSMTYFEEDQRRAAAEFKPEPIDLNDPGWVGPDGKPALPAAAERWYSPQLLDDFVLRGNFIAPTDGNALAKILLWTPWAGLKPAKLARESWARRTCRALGRKLLFWMEPVSAPAPAKGHCVSFRGPAAHCAPTGTIDRKKPVRIAPLVPESNNFEIVCLRDKITVCVNGETINERRVKRAMERRNPFSRQLSPVPSVIGLEAGPVQFSKLSIQRIKADGVGATQGEVQRRIVFPLLVAAFLGTLLFHFGDSKPGSENTAMMEWLQGQRLPPAKMYTFFKAAWFTGAACAGLVFLAQLCSVIRIPLERPDEMKTRAPLMNRFKAFVRSLGGPVGGIVYTTIETGKSIGRPVAGAARKTIEFLKSVRGPVGGAVRGMSALVKNFGRITRVTLLFLRRLGRPVGRVVRATVAIGLAGAAGGVLARWLYDVFQGTTAWEVMTWGPPALVGAFFITIILFIGLLGRKFEEERREWWSRLLAWLLIYSLGWLALFSLAIYAPVAVNYALAHGKGWLASISVGWLFSTVSGLVAARSADTGKAKPNKLVEAIATVAPYIFVVGFLVALSSLVDALMGYCETIPWPAQQGFVDLLGYQWKVLYASLERMEWLLPLTAAGFLLSAVLSWRLDINLFSMHPMYRNRLGRCYLGASNRYRRAQPFTGFSNHDDLKLADLAGLNYRGTNSAPYPLLNATLNLVGGRELAWQQRKGASFVFSPLFCGYEFPELPPGFSPTREFAGETVSLATAMAISGAAASPNMGYHTSPAPAFLMTVFNVRLGWWLGNPRRRSGWEKPGPINVLFSLLQELFGLTNERGKYIYLSDGGHFENLGIYELVRRRCRFIIACDAEEDHNFGFGGLGNAIEKCRADFGIDIAIDVEAIRRRSERGYSRWHCAIGKIRYSVVDPDGRDGILVYLKSSLTGDEPTDILRYAAQHPEFPHQTTGDQWFDESQFESYRMLGYHIVQDVFGAVDDTEKLAELEEEDLFVRLSQRWYPPSTASREAFTRHTRDLVALYDELRTNKDLIFITEQIYPEWRAFFEEPQTGWRRLKWRLPGRRDPLRISAEMTEDQLRTGFYFCNSIFQLMEEVYLDLELEKQYDHPDNRGWMNLFRHWSWVPMVRIAWTVSASNYGARFQSFCQRHISLTVGTTGKGEVDLKKLAPPYLSSENVERTARETVETMVNWLGNLSAHPEVLAWATEAALKDGAGAERDPGKTLQEVRVAVFNELSPVLKELKEKSHALLLEGQVDGIEDEWYGGAKLLEMIWRGANSERIKKQAARVAEFALLHAAQIHQRLNPDGHWNHLNTTEHELIELFFAYNPSLIGSAKIVYFYLSPAYEGPGIAVRPKLKDLKFPFGFAITANFQEDDESFLKLVYFRIQDHVRRTGLARQALSRLIEDEGLDLGIDLHPMHPEAHEVPTPDDEVRFLRLFDSVRTEFQQPALSSAR